MNQVRHPGLRRIAWTAACLFLLILTGGSLLAPRAWQWNTPNLQVRFQNLHNERQESGSFGQTAGWSKLDFFTGNWWRGSGGDSREGSGRITEATSFRIVRVSPGGVSVCVHHEEKREDTNTSFDRLIFIPGHGVARVDISRDFSISGEFQ